jgi:hypothetical protein
MERFRNRAAAFLWGFASVWCGMLGIMTYVLFRDGAPAGHSWLLVITIFVLFWACGVGLLVYAASHPCISVVVDGKRVSVTWRYPHRSETQSYPAAHLPKAQVTAEKDSEGDPYYFVRVTLSEGRNFELRQSHSRDVCQQVCSRFNDALSGSRHGA